MIYELFWVLPSLVMLMGVTILGNATRQRRWMVHDNVVDVLLWCTDVSTTLLLMEAEEKLPAKQLTTNYK